MSYIEDPVGILVYLITLIGLGIPGDVTAAVMLGALLIHDVVPSPTFISDEPVLVYSIFTAFFIATFMMIFLTLQEMHIRFAHTRVTYLAVLPFRPEVA